LEPLEEYPMRIEANSNRITELVKKKNELLTLLESEEMIEKLIKNYYMSEISMKLIEDILY